MSEKEIKIFVGVDALIKWVSVLALQTTSLHKKTELNKIVTELYLLDAGLKSLRFDRGFLDDCDVDLFLDHLRGLEHGCK